MGLDNNQIENSNINNDEISLKEIILKIKNVIIFLKSKWKIIFIACFFGSITGLTYALFQKTTYKAVLTFAMEDDKAGSGSLSGALGIASSFGIDLGGAGGGGAFAASNLAELMKSRLMVEKVLLEPILIHDKTISLAEYYIQINDLRKSWDKNPTLNKIQFLPNADRSNFTIEQDSILKQIHKSLIDKEKLSIMQKDKKVTILSIEVTSIDEFFSKTFCEKLANSTSNFYIETKSKKSRINMEVLQRQVDSVRNALNGSISGVANEIDNVYNLNPAFNIKAAASKKKQIDVQANTSILTNLVVQLELAKITLRKETPLIQLIDSPILPLEKIKTSKLKSIIIYGALSFLISVFLLILTNIYKKNIS
jgi:uncharacterized protein involved in exopolysaccharide biosynthesis